MSVQSEINRITTEVSDQTSLISQIKTALAGKVAGGGSGSGGTSVETCTVTVIFNSSSCGYIKVIGYTTLDSNGELTGTAFTNAVTTLRTKTINNVVRGTMLSVSSSVSIAGLGITTDNANYLAASSNTMVFNIVAGNGATATIGVNGVSGGGSVD